MQQTSSTHASQLAQFALRAQLEPGPARDAMKIRVLDALGCALGALHAGPPVEAVRQYVEEFGGARRSLLIGSVNRTFPPLAALYNGFLVRYLDYNDSYLASGETCHPSDNLAPVLAAAQDADADGVTLLNALAVAYQVQCRLCDVAPVRDKGFDHTVQGSYAVAAGAARALGLDVARAAQAIAIAGTAFNALRVTRTGRLSHWKGLAYPNTAFCCLHATYLAQRGVTGPELVFEGNKGFMQAIAGPFEIDWQRERLDRVLCTSLKRYNAEIHSQSVLEALQELQRERRFAAGAVQRVEVDVFDVAHRIIGGGEEGDKRRGVSTKEQADHSLPYLCAALLLDGEVTPRQYELKRILAPDVQDLLQRVHVRPDPELSRQFPEQMPCRVRVITQDGSCHAGEKLSYRGFWKQPWNWEDALAKFDQLAAALPAVRRQRIAECVAQLERRSARQLGELLEARE